MDREVILEHLAQAERHIAAMDTRVAQQKMLVERLDGDGADSATAKILLLEYEHSLALHRADWERLQGRLRNSSVLLRGRASAAGSPAPWAAGGANLQT
jgi:hypothetical protein